MRRRTETAKRPRSVYCSPGERDALGERAAAAGVSVSSFVLERALGDGGGKGEAPRLSEAERAELHDGVRRLIGFADVIRGAVADEGSPEEAAAKDGGR